ncbi:adenylate cyclase [Mariprofundus aestuarium]|uniref:Adenylate cyclase n=1 Tax=Mariprofundus aestuarium TaxID=1921086 RepID=A0A2K8L625_MARES|nr:adenylate/guanylate cyclase domain-containing protein [Mariprofundus aestuarium]ATX80424.1 adenylate cyclase [Mariprofundus aestuarium]
MQKINKAQLVTSLLELFASKQAVAIEAASLQQQIESAIDRSLVNTQEVDSREVTILLSDLRGFTSIAEQYTSLEMVAVLNRYFACMNEIIIRHGGTIDKFMGDSIMALFGAPIEAEDDIEAALACAIEMQVAMGEINRANSEAGFAPLHMGIGINTGEVVAGYLGSALHSEYTVIGDQVNLTSRVEAHSLRGQILLSENTYRLARDYIEVGHINEVKVKGKKGAVRMYELLSVSRPRVLVAPAREIRNSPRVEADMPVVFQLLDGKQVLPKQYHGSIVDLSYGGMYIESPVSIEPFCDIKISMAVSLMSAELTDIYAKVLRVSEVNGSYECRAEFTFLEPHAQQVIKEFVDGIVEANRGY